MIIVTDMKYPKPYHMKNDITCLTITLHAIAIRIKPAASICNVLNLLIHLSTTAIVVKLLSKLYNWVPSISAYSESSEQKWTSNAINGTQCQSKPWYTEEKRKRDNFYFK